MEEIERNNNNNISFNDSIEVSNETEEQLGENELLIKHLTTLFVPLTFAAILFVGLIGNILVIVVVSTFFQAQYFENMIFFFGPNALRPKQ